MVLDSKSKNTRISGQIIAKKQEEAGKNSLHSCDLNELYLSFIQKLWYTDNVTKLLDR